MITKPLARRVRKMPQSRAYYQTLRAIGQSLEAQKVNSFDLKCNGDNYFVQSESGKPSSTLQGWLQKWQGQAKDSFQLNYTPEHIERLERDGRERRREPHRLPDFHSLSNILRTVGAYLDVKAARLLRVHKEDLSITILYQTSQGHPEIEERTVASFYDLSVQMYKKREKRPLS